VLEAFLRLDAAKANEASRAICARLAARVVGQINPIWNHVNAIRLDAMSLQVTSDLAAIGDEGRDVPFDHGRRPAADNFLFAHNVEIETPPAAAHFCENGLAQEGPCQCRRKGVKSGMDDMHNVEFVATAQYSDHKLDTPRQERQHMPPAQIRRGVQAKALDGHSVDGGPFRRRV